MDTSSFVASIIGPLYIAVAIGILVSPDFYRKMVSDFIRNTGLYYLSGALAFVLGIVLVQLHNLWVEDWRVIITLIGWMSLLKGTIRLIFPSFGIDLAASLAENRSSFRILAIICFFFGGWLTYMGYGG